MHAKCLLHDLVEELHADLLGLLHAELLWHMIRLFDDELLDFFVSVRDGEVGILSKLLVEQEQHALLFRVSTAATTAQLDIIPGSSHSSELLVLKHQSLFFIN